MWLTIFTILVGFVCIFYIWMRKQFSYFRSKGIAEDPGYFPLGSNTSWRLLTGRLAFVQKTDDTYKNFPNEKVVGKYGVFGSRLLVVRDIDIAKHVLVKDFDHFVDRRNIELSMKANKYFNGMLLMMTGEKWKTMRSIMSPVFTSGKLKSMMPTIHKVGDEFVSYLKDFSGIEFNAKDLMTSYTLDVISSAGLGVEANSFTDPNSIMRKKVDLLMGANNSDPFGILRVLFIMGFPKVAKFLDVPFINKEATEFFVRVIRSSVEFRQKENIRKNDLIDVMVECLKDFQNTGKETKFESQFEADAAIDAKLPQNVFSAEEVESFLISNALLFFMGGFDTSSNSMAITSYFLATNPEIQEELFREVEESINKNGGDEHLDYNEIQTLPYLDQVVLEALRMYPLTLSERLCVKDYKIPGIDFVVPKGMLVQVASPMFMKDEKFFSQPEVFNPDNFSAKNKSERNPYASMPFGQGPRNCIGMRFALLQVKAAIVRLVYNYRILQSEKTVDKLIPDPLSRSMMPKGGIWIKVEKRST